jgi:hypothetical protein
MPYLPDIGVGQWIQILEMQQILLRFESAAVALGLNSDEIHHFWTCTNYITWEMDNLKQGASNPRAIASSPEAEGKSGR